MAPDVCIVRTTVARKFSLSAKRVKELHFLWFQFVNFYDLYGNHSQGNCHLRVATMAIQSFGDMCRFNMVVDLSERVFNLNRNY